MRPVWWHRPAIPAIWRLRQEEYKFKDRLGNLVRSCVEIVKMGWGCPFMAKCVPSTHEDPGVIPKLQIDSQKFMRKRAGSMVQRYLCETPDHNPQY